MRRQALTALLAAAILFTPSPAFAASGSYAAPDLTVTENAGSATAVICRLGGSGKSTVTIQTAGVTAKAATDYVAISKLLTFQSPGCQSVLIQIVNDSVNEPTETFQIILTAGQNATLLKSRGTITITDDDAAPPPPPPPVQCPDGTTVPAGQTCPVPPPPTTGNPTYGDTVEAVAACIGSYIPDALTVGAQYRVIGLWTYRPGLGLDAPMGTPPDGAMLNPVVDDGLHRGDGWQAYWVPFSCVKKV